MWFREASSATVRDVRRLLACVAWRFWLLSDKGGRGQKNCQEIGAGAIFIFSRLRRSCALLDKTAMLRRLGGCRVTGKRVFVSRTICISYSHGMERGRWGAERIHVWRSGRRSSIGHFTGFGISLIIWSSWFGIWKKNRGEKVESLRGRWDTKNNPRDYGIARNLKSGLRDWRTTVGDPPGRQLDEGTTPRGSTRFSFKYPFWQKRYALGSAPPPVILMWKTREACPLSQIARVLFFVDLVYATSLLAPARLARKCCCFCQQSHKEIGIKSDWLYCRPCCEERKYPAHNNPAGYRWVLGGAKRDE